MTIEILNLGLVDYKKTLEYQLELLQRIHKNPAQQDYIVFCTHPEVVTLGRSSVAEEYKDWKGEVVEVSRGGRATYHGPSQLVIYPILNLSRAGRENFKPNDLHSYLRALENFIIRGLKDLGLEAESRSEETLVEGKKLSLTGVWVGDKKIASIGVAVKNWISYHGVSINIENDQKAYQGIQPCGFSRDIMTSIEALKGPIDRSEVQEAFKNQLGCLF